MCPLPGFGRGRMSQMSRVMGRVDGSTGLRGHFDKVVVLDGLAMGLDDGVM